jgi:hypothetical protein
VNKGLLDGVDCKDSRALARGAAHVTTIAEVVVGLERIGFVNDMLFGSTPSSIVTSAGESQGAGGRGGCAARIEKEA